MYKFEILSNGYLSRNIQAFYHADYQGGNRVQRETTGTVENIICMLKNQFQDKDPRALRNASQLLTDILLKDLLDIQQIVNLSLTVCVTPRAKENYNTDQLLFKLTVADTIRQLENLSDGTDYIIRHTDTRTTHLDRSGYGGNGMMPYPGITKDTCTISKDVKDKDILLIDDLYTKTINIDEDAIQALLDNGARNVFFYSVGKTTSMF